MSYIENDIDRKNIELENNYPDAGNPNLNGYASYITICLP